MHRDQVLRKSKDALLETLAAAYHGSQSAVTWRDRVWHAGGFRQQCKCMDWKYQVPWCWGQALPSIQVRQPNSLRNTTLNYKTSHATLLRTLLLSYELSTGCLRMKRAFWKHTILRLWWLQILRKIQRDQNISKKSRDINVWQRAKHY